ncbi:hypothetical protein BRARA_K00619, partial [Brassica rapa]
MSAILIIAFLFSFTLVSYRFFKKTRDGMPPSPPSLPLLGHLHHLLLNPQIHQALSKLSANTGPYFHIRLFKVPVIVVSSASVAQEFFKENDINISSRGLPAVDEALMFGEYGVINSPYGIYWKQMKKLMLVNLLGSQAIVNSRGVRAEELQRFFSILVDKAAKSETVDMSKEAFKLVSDVMCRMSLGRRFREEDGELEKLNSLITESSRLVKKMFVAVVVRRSWIGRLLTFKRHIMFVSAKFDEFLERILEEYEAEPNKDQKSEMLDAFLKAYRDENAELK